MGSGPFVSGRETPVQRIRYFAFAILVINAVLLALYGSVLKPRLLEWAANRPDLIDAAYYRLVFGYLELPIIITLLFSALVIGFARKIVQMVRSMSKTEHWLPVILVLVVLIQAGIAFWLDTKPHSDSIFYLERAEHLATTFTYSTSVGEPTAFWPVGYPAMLAVVRLVAGHSLMAYRVLHILVYIALVYVLYRSFRRAGGKQVPLFMFTVLYAFHPNGLFSVNAVLTEFPFMLLMWLGLFYLLGEKHRPWRVVLGGVCLGAAALIKPLVLGLAFLLGIYFVLTRRTKNELLRMAVFAGAFTLVILPWLVRNTAHFGTFVPVSTNGGMNFYIGNNPDATGKFESIFLPLKPGMNEAERSSAAFAAGIEYIVDHPVEAARLIPKKLFYAFWRGDASITWSIKELGRPVQNFVPAVLFYIANLIHYIMLFGLVIMVWYRKWIFTSDTQNGLFAMTFLYFIVVVVVFFGSERFMAPVMPIPLWFLANWFAGGYSLMDSFIAGRPEHVRRAESNSDGA